MFALFILRVTSGGFPLSKACCIYSDDLPCGFIHTRAQKHSQTPKSKATKCDIEFENNKGTATIVILIAEDNRKK